MHPAVYGSSPPPSISDLSPFPESVVILICAWLAILALRTLWARSTRRSRLPAVFLMATLICACTSTGGLPQANYGVWRTGPDDEPASVTIWRNGEASLRLGGEVLELRR